MTGRPRRIAKRLPPASPGARATDIIVKGTKQRSRKGVPNIVTRELKEMILTALSDVGGVDYLVQVALKKPEAFMALLSRLLPHTLQGPNGKPIEVIEIKTFEVASAAHAAIREGAQA